MHYLCTGELPDGTMQPQHDYGPVVILLAGLAHFAPPGTGRAAPPRRHDDISRCVARRRDQSAEIGRGFSAEARQLEDALPEPSRTVMHWVNTRDVKTMGPKLLPFIEELGGAAALSPERSPATHVPVFLLHGSHDNVIPYSETPRLEAYLRAQGNARVTSLLTPLISHANVEAAPSAVEVWKLSASGPQCFASLRTARDAFGTFQKRRDTARRLRVRPRWRRHPLCLGEAWCPRSRDAAFRAAAATSRRVASAP